MIQSCQCNCCTTRNRMSTADIIFKLDGVAAYNKAEPSGGDLERLHQHNLKLQSELDKARAQVAELKIISSRNADNWIKHLNISTKQSEAIKIFRDAVDKNMEISGNVNLTRPLRQGDKEFMNDCSDEILKIYKNSKEALSKVEALLGGDV